MKPNLSSGLPLYLQLIEQIKHAIETGALRPGEQLPAIRSLAEQLVMNPNTIAKVYRELEHDKVIELRQGSGAFVSERMRKTKSTSFSLARPVIRLAIEKLRAKGLTEEEIRRLFEAELIKDSELARR